MKKIILGLLLLALPVFVAAQDAQEDVFDGGKLIYDGISQFGRGLVHGGMQILSVVLPNPPLWFASILELGVSLLALYLTLNIGKTTIRYMALFLVLLIIVSIIMGSI